MSTCTTCEKVKIAFYKGVYTYRHTSKQTCRLISPVRFGTSFKIAVATWYVSGNIFVRKLN